MEVTRAISHFTESNGTLLPDCLLTWSFTRKKNNFYLVYVAVFGGTILLATYPVP